MVLCSRLKQNTDKWFLLGDVVGQHCQPIKLRSEFTSRPIFLYFIGQWKIFVCELKYIWSSNGILCCYWLKWLFTKWIHWTHSLLNFSLYEVQRTLWDSADKTCWNRDKKRRKEESVEFAVFCCMCQQNLIDNSQSCERKLQYCLLMLHQKSIGHIQFKLVTHQFWSTHWQFVSCLRCSVILVIIFEVYFHALHFST